jgi:mono/diheme cytochrome c family protein
MAAAVATPRSAKRSRAKPYRSLSIGEAGRRIALAAVLLLASRSPSSADGDAAARGAYLAGAAGCEHCHTDTDHGGRPYAGGRLLTTAFGVIATPNLTPDRATGIGRWSAADFTRALRWGIAPDDSHYVPAFPFLFYNRLSDSDLGDIKAFLDSLPAVSRSDLNGGGSTALVARARAALVVVATPLPGPWQPDPEKDPVWNRGAYLVASLGRCGDCHTPRTLLGVSDTGRFLAGAPAGLDSKKIPNITSDRKTGIGNWTMEDIVGVLTDGHTPEFDEVGGSMAEIVKNTARLTEEDRRAIAVFLQSVPAVSSRK